MTCPYCGHRATGITAMNEHYRACDQLDVEVAARTIVDRGDYLDGEAERVATAYLAIVEAR